MARPRKEDKPAAKRSRGAAKTAKAPAPEKEGKKAYVFFNCNAEESNLDIFYNHEIYRDVQVSRKALWAKIQAELTAGRIQIAEENMDAVKDAILAGEPTDAGQYITYGAIRSFDCF